MNERRLRLLGTTTNRLRTVVLARLREAAALDVGCRGAPFSRRSGALREALFSASLLNAVAEVDDAAGESVLIDELKIGARLGRQCGVAPT
jgi:hypothetical protein